MPGSMSVATVGIQSKEETNDGSRTSRKRVAGVLTSKLVHESIQP